MTEITYADHMVKDQEARERTLQLFVSGTCDDCGSYWEMRIRLCSVCERYLCFDCYLNHVCKREGDNA